MAKSHKFQVDTSGYLYERVAQTLSEQIRQGNLRAGDRCPSVRQVGQQFSVSTATAVQALGLLERRGLIEARPQSGFYIRSVLSADALLGDDDHLVLGKVKPVRVETAALINEVLYAVGDPRAVPLGAATVSSDLLPGPRLYKSMNWAMKNLGADGLHYEMPPGNPDLRRQIARLSFSAGCNLSADDIIITSGSMEAISISLRAVTKPGDTVAIESPMYYGIIDLLSSLGLRAAEIATHPCNGLDVECLRDTLSKQKIAAVLAIPNFNNPCGSKMPDEAKKALVKLLAEHNIPLIEDDVYGDLQHDGKRPVACKAFDKKGLVLYCSSFSKTLSPGIRIGWIAPGQYFATIERLKFVSSIATNTIAQAAIAHFLEQDTYRKHLSRLRRELKTRLEQYSFAVQKYFPSGTKISRPEGGFCLWVQLPEGCDALKLYDRLREKGISILPGPAFSSVLGNYNNCLRLTCGHALSSRMERAVATIGAEAHQLS